MPVRHVLERIEILIARGDFDQLAPLFRMYQAANGPGRLVLSEFQYSRSKAGGFWPLR